MTSQLRQRFERHLVLQRLAPRTQKAYIGAIAGIAKYFNCSPDRLSDEQIQEYMAHQLRHLSWSSCNVTFCAFNCFYNKFLNRKRCAELKIPPRPRQKRLPEILSKQEVLCLIENAKDLRHRAVLMMTYGSGLRVGEVVCLTADHIEADRMLVRVEQSKGRKDRYTLLSCKALETLRFYHKIYKPGKFLFTGRNRSQPMPIATARKMYKFAKAKAGLTKGKSIHTLRHCFATHLLMNGVDIQLIKNFLGHSQIESTLVYLHMVPNRIADIKSPLDDLA